MIRWFRQVLTRRAKLSPLGGFFFIVWEDKNEIIVPIWVGVDPFDVETPYGVGRKFRWTLNVSNRTFGIKDPRHFNGNVRLEGESYTEILWLAFTPFLGPCDTGFSDRHPIWSDGITISEWEKIADPPCKQIKKIRSHIPYISNPPNGNAVDR